MTFWGVEVKPGIPFTFSAEDMDGKLILTQATLGTSSSTKKSTLQVNVGDKSPIFLCSLLPDKIESCSLNLEFAEDDDVKFSVVGPTSIHLSGFVQDYHGHDDDSDSFGEDLADLESEGCDYDSEDDYEDEDEDKDVFFDEDHVTLLQPSPAQNSGVIIEEIVDDEKAANENGGTKETKKKKQLVDSDKKNIAGQEVVDNGDTVSLLVESEDEDGFPISSSVKSETKFENSEAKISTGIVEEGKKRKKKKGAAKDDGESGKCLKRKADGINRGDEQKSDATEAADGDAHENKKKKKQKNKKKAKTEKEEDFANVKKDASMEDEQISKIDKEAKKSKAKPAKVRTFPNGLVIEEVAMGKPNGKRASRGSKVSVHYIGKLQKNGKHFDSNMGRKPFKFRLGIGAVIKGWDVGLEGMRVGDKRRLTIPPSMGYGSSGAPPQIPPNAWLVFDVELVDVA